MECHKRRFAGMYVNMCICALVYEGVVFVLQYLFL